MKGKIVGIFLLLCFVAPPATTFVILQFQKKQVKREVKWKMIAGIDKDELVLLKFTEPEKQSQLNWKHSREFEYEGEMYDIVKSNILGDTTYYWLWWDHEETKLNKQLDNLVSFALGHNPKKQEHQKRLNTFFKSLYFPEPIERKTPAFQLRKSLFFTYPDFYQSVSNSPPVPPPEIG